MNARVLGAAFALVALAISGCDEKEQKPTTTPSATATSTASVAASTTATTTASQAAAPEEEIPTAAEFEVEAEGAITAANYKAELATLEAEVAKE